jgi:tetratricopeptide (TPR) repeat protein
MVSEALALANKLADAEAQAQKALEYLYAADYADPEGLAAIYQQLGILSVMRGHEGALEYFEKAIKANQRDQWPYKLADACVILDMTGILMEGTPQQRRARLLGYAQQRGREYSSYLEWKEASGT